MISLLIQGISWILNILFPVACIVCDKEGPDLCADCIGNFKWPKPTKIPWITSLWNYRDPNVERMVRHIKNLPNGRIACIIAGLFSERILNRPENPESWVVTSLPISRKRFRERGYNQSELLAKPIAQTFGFPYLPDVLTKARHTAKQGTSKTKEDRLANVVGAFTVRKPELILNKNVILIDDVTTTGATLSEARKALLLSGAARVIAWTVAN